MPISAEGYKLLAARAEHLQPAPETFDRERLKAAIVAAAGLPDPRGDGDRKIIEAVVEVAAASVYYAWRKIRLSKEVDAPPTKKLRNLHKALAEWMDTGDPQGSMSWEWILLLQTFRRASAVMSTPA
jgi:hypothetical protein